MPPRAPERGGPTGPGKCQAGPRKNVPITVRTIAHEQQAAEHQYRHLAVAGLGRRVPVDVGQQHQYEHDRTGHEDPGHQRVEVRQQLLEAPKKYQGAFDGSGVRFGLARARRSGATNATPIASTHGEPHRARRPHDEPRSAARRTPCRRWEVLGRDRLAGRRHPSTRLRAFASGGRAAAGAHRHAPGGLARRSPPRRTPPCRRAPRSRPCAPARCGRQQHGERRREHGDVQRVEAQQRRLADLVAAEQQVLERAPITGT